VLDAGPPLRDDALDPPLTWKEAVRRAVDSHTLPDAFASAGYSLPSETELFAARIIEGAGTSAYVYYQAGGGGFRGDFWPASTIKLLAAVAALEKVRGLGFTGGAEVTFDSGFSDRLGIIYDRSIRVSSNIDYVRTFRVAGFDWMNTTFLAPERGLPDSVLQRSYERGVSVREVPGYTLTEDGRSEYVPATTGVGVYDCPSDGNCTDLFELTEGVRRVMLHDEVTAPERFDLDPVDVRGLHDALCAATPSFFAAGAERAFGAAAAVCHKPGWVGGLDCLDHAVITDPSTGDRFLLAASTPDPTGSGSCPPLDRLAELALRALGEARGGTAMQVDGGIPIVVQLDSNGRTDEGRFAYRLTVEAPGAEHVELGTDGWSIGSASGPGPRFVVDYDYEDGGERLLTVRALRDGVPVGFRALRVVIE
jgi:hypothetical protein